MRYILHDLPESGRWVVVDDTNGRWVGEPTTDYDLAERKCARLNRAATPAREYVTVRCTGCGNTLDDAVPLSQAASLAPIYCDPCDPESL